MPLSPRLLDCFPERFAQPQILAITEDLVVVNKPAGFLTHPDGTGLRPDVVTALNMGSLGVHERLDVDTSGVICLSRTPRGAKLLQSTFEGHAGHKFYYAVVEGRTPDRGVLRDELPTARGKPAVTRFRKLKSGSNWTLLEVEPETGRTHQIRIHFAQKGSPCRGDARYGDPLELKAPRTLLHCHAVVLADGTRFEAPYPPDFARYFGDSPAATRAGLSSLSTTAYREWNGVADGHPGLSLDRYGDYLFAQADADVSLARLPDARGVYLCRGERDRSHGQQLLPTLFAGEAAPKPLHVLEAGVSYAVQLGEHLSTGLFLDQRPQRAWLAEHASGMRILNTFAHAGGFSVAAATAGATTVSIDLSADWLSRIPEQIKLNGLDPAPHDTIYGDVFDWVRRLGKRGEKFDLVILDPPSTSVGTTKRRFSAAKDYPELAALAAPLVSPGGQLWTLCNLRQMSPRTFAQNVQKALPNATLERVCPPGVDFPSDEPLRSKVFWWRL